jgi:branched-chain amino acid transport system permease protein
LERSVDEFLRLTIFGLVAAAVYFVAASGLVLTYTTSGIFNFGHGALGMMAAFVYWELRVHHHWPAPLALVAVLGVLAPLAGMLVERVLIRNLRGASLATTLVVTVGLLAGLIGLAHTIWKPASRNLEPFFGANRFKVLGVYVTWHQGITILIAAAVAIGLRVFLYRTRIGIAMRAVVDNGELASLNGTRPNRVSSLSWALGTSLAALAGILLAPVLSLEVIALTLLVLSAYAAAMVGRLRSLPMTLLGAVILGLLVQYVPSYLPKLFANDTMPGWLTNISTALPMIMLFVVLLVLPGAQLRGWHARPGAVIRIPGLRASLVGGGLLVTVAVVCSRVLSARDIPRVGLGLAMGLIVLSLVPLTGWAGQVSLCQLTLAGVGACAMAKLGAHGEPLGLLAAMLVTGAVGALIALPALRLQGLYLALSTLAFAVFMDNMVFPRRDVFYSGTIPVGRLDLGFFSFDDDRSYFVLLAIAFAVMAVVVLALRRGPFGRRLAAMRDSPAACATLGLDLTRTKLAVFTLSAAMAGLAGALYGGLKVTVGSENFTLEQGLPVLLLAVVGGIATVSGALFGGMFFVLLTIVSEEVKALSWVLVIGPGLVGVTLGRSPDGAVPEIAARFRALRAGRGAGRTDAVQPTREPELTTLGIDRPFDPSDLATIDRVLDIEEVEPVGTAPG